MQLLIKKYNFLKENAILGLLFSFLIIEVVAELFSFKVILFAFRPMLAILLIDLYWVVSKERRVLFYLSIFFTPYQYFHSF
jgi:hypothetical protein